MALQGKKYKIGLGVQAAVLLLLLILAFLPKYDRTFQGSELGNQKGQKTIDGSLVIEEGQEGVGVFFTTEELSLGYGVYEIVINYETNSDKNMVYLTTPDIMSGSQDENGKYYTNALILSSDVNEVTEEAYIKYKRSDYVVAGFYMGDSSFIINSIRIKKTPGGMLKIMLIMAAVFAMMDAGIFLYGRRKKNELSDEDILTGILLSGIIFLSSLPLMLNYMIEGHDLPFHLLRIEGIKDAVKMGIFPVKIQPNWLNGNGYAVSVFYGDVLLYIPALLRLCGFNITQSYNIYVFLMNIATCLISYYSFRKMSGSRKAGIIGSCIYTLSLYRIINLYVRTAVGEYSAMTFLPMIIYGMWKIFTEDNENEDYKKNWIIPVIGFTGIINTHILTCEMVGGFIILLCLILIKKVFKKQTFIVLVKVVVYTCILNMGFLVPFFDYMLRGGFIVTDGQRFSSGIQQYGAFLGQMLMPFTTYSGLSVTSMSGMAEEMPTAIGFYFVFGAALYVYAVLTGKVKNRADKVTGWICLGFGVLAVMFSADFFPWDYLQGMNRLFDKLISMISMPWRFLTIASAVMTVTTIIGINAITDEIKLRDYAVNGICIICIVQSAFLMSSIMNNAPRYGIYSECGIDNSYVIGAEYLPNGSLTESFKTREVVGQEGLKTDVLSQQLNSFSIRVENESQNVQYVELPMVYYAGYQAKDADAGIKFNVSRSQNHKVQIEIQPGYAGNIKVRFAGFWYWNVAVIVSFVAAVVIAKRARGTVLLAQFKKK